MRTGWRGIAAGALLVLATASVEASESASPAPDTPEVVEFRAFLRKVNDAQVEFVQGRPAAFKALWSQRPDVTIFGGFGSGDHGWEKVGPRLEWGSAQFSKGSRSHEVLTTHVSGDLGYVVQIERITFTVPGQAKETLARAARHDDHAARGRGLAGGPPPCRPEHDAAAAAVRSGSA
jgi:hypothetical protein